mgnify:CR=1 FL=1
MMLSGIWADTLRPSCHSLVKSWNTASSNEVVLAYSSSGELSVKFGFKLYLPISGESVSVVTPALKEPPSTMKNPTGAEHPKFMATQTWEAVQRLLDEAEKYINGKRAQGNLFESDVK